MKITRLAAFSGFAAAFLAASPALASYHLMKIEQVIGGVGGDTSQQAIQLRMRAAGQNLVGSEGARLIAWNSLGLNPVILLVFPTDVANSVEGSRILVVTSAFAMAQPGIAADFTMTNPIPQSYLGAGRLTFEDHLGTILWSVAWGGSAYLGPNTGTTINDADGNFSPPFASALPSTTTQALRFTAADPTGSTASTNNAADYAPTGVAATFTSNAGASGTVSVPSADLSVTQTDSPDPVASGQSLTYTIAVANGGPTAATGVIVADTLPAGTAFQSAVGTGWTCGEAAGVATCTRPILAVGLAPAITLTLTAPASGGTITNHVRVDAFTDPDPNPANNSSSEVTTVNGPPSQADLLLTMSDGGVDVFWDEALSYSIVVTNLGPAPVSGATLSDSFAPEFVGTQWSCAGTAGSSCVPPSGTGDIATSLNLLSGGSVTVTAAGTVAASTPTLLVNTASVATAVGVTDPTPANNSSTVSTVVIKPSYYTVAPCRMFDTRDPGGPTSGQPLAANTASSFQLRGACGIPETAKAAALNVTVVSPTDLGNLRLYASGGPAPLASTINFAPGAVRANNTVLGFRSGAGPSITVQCDMPPGSSGAVHVIVDVAGYFR